MNFQTVDEALDFAIAREEESYRFYMDLAGRMESGQTRKTFEDFAKEELGHKKKIESIKVKGIFKRAEKSVQSLNLADYLVDAEITSKMDIQDALLVAMKKEKAAFKLYLDLAAATDDEGIKEVFNMLAQEEAKHKLRFELEYDSIILTEN